MTSKALKGWQVIYRRGDIDLVATIKRLDKTYPKTAYTVTWDKVNNPSYDWPNGVEHMYSIAHFSTITP